MKPELTDDVKILYYECWLAGVKMGEAIRSELQLSVPDDAIMELGEKVGVSMAIDAMRGAGGGSGQRAATGGGGSSGPLAPHPCPECGGKVWDNRDTKKGNQPDFKCQRKDKCGWAAWVKGKQKGGGTFTRSLSDIFGLEGDEGYEADFSNEALEAEGDKLPF